MRIVYRISVSALALALAAVSPAEGQLTSVSPDCNFILDVDPDAIACSGAWYGNNKNQEAEVLAQIEADWGSGSTDPEDYWFEVGYSEDLDYEATSGTITFVNPIEKEFVLALRAANQFSLYYFDGVGAPYTSIDWVTSGTSVNKNGQPQGLSGWTVYNVPEPATVFLLGAGLLAMTGMAWRRRDEVIA